MIPSASSKGGNNQNDRVDWKVLDAVRHLSTHPREPRAEILRAASQCFYQANRLGRSALPLAASSTLGRTSQEGQSPVSSPLA